MPFVLLFHLFNAVQLVATHIAITLMTFVSVMTNFSRTILTLAVN